MNTNVYYIDIGNFIDNFMPGMMQSYDYSVVDGDFEVGDTDEQEMFFILQASPGNFYYYPKLGYSMFEKIADNINIPAEKKAISFQLQNDGFTVDEINILTAKDINRVTNPQVRAILESQKVLFNIKARRA